jgi:hypothetical protein
MHKCFYCDKEGNYVIDEKEGMLFLCKKHYKIFLAKYGQKPKKQEEEE